MVVAVVATLVAATLVVVMVSFDDPQLSYHLILFIVMCT